MLSTPKKMEAAVIGTALGWIVSVTLLVSGCQGFNNEYGIVLPLEDTGTALSSDGRGQLGPKDADYSDTAVWEANNAWADTDTAAAKEAGLAWQADSGLNWEHKYALWVDGLEATAAHSGYGTTFQLVTPTGKVLPAPYLECAEATYFLRSLFASWYGLPFFVEAVDGQGQRIFFGHFGFINHDGSRYGNTPNFSKYDDHSGLTASDIASQGWPSDSTLRGRAIYGTASDDQPFLGEDAHFGHYLDELLLNKRTGYFMMILLPYFGSVNLADDANAYHLKSDGLTTGAVLIERWQRTGIGHALMVKEVQWLGSDEAAAELISGSMPRRQPKWESATASKMTFTSNYTGGVGESSDGDAYADLGGGLKAFMTATTDNGYWLNHVPADRLDHFIPSSDTTAKAARPAEFEELLAEVDPEDMIDELLAILEDKRAHLRNYPSSCSARISREDTFDQLYDVLQMERGWDRQRADEEYRTLEDYVFAELEYSDSKTCCWNSTTNEMYDIVMDYNRSMMDADPDSCIEPDVFKAEDSGYERFEAYAVDTGRGDQWVAWSADENCPQASVSNDTETAHGWTDFCDIADELVDGGNGGNGGSTSGDSYEPNDSSSQAAPIGEGGYSGLSIDGNDDHDWFEVAAGGSTVTARIDFSHASGDLDLHLLDGNGNELDSSAGTSDSEQTSASATTVRIHVFGYSGATGSYDLTVTVD